MLRTNPVLPVLSVVVMLSAGLSACASFQEQQYKRPAAPASSLASPPGDAGSLPRDSGQPVRVPSASGAYPHGAAEEAPNAAVDGDGGDVYVRGPDGSVWQGTKRDSDAHNADIEACYRYAEAQTENDARIEQDRRAVYGDGIGDTQSAGLLNSKIRSYDHETRRRSLFSSCMRSKGYAAR